MTLRMPVFVRPLAIPVLDLVVRTPGVTFVEGKLVLADRVARYVAEIVRVDAP